MRDETNASSQDKQAVQNTHVEVVLCLFRAERTAVPQQVYEADRDATVNIQNEVVLLRGRHRLNGQGIVEELVARELGEDVLLDEFHTQIRVVPRLDSVANARDELVG